MVRMVERMRKCNTNDSHEVVVSIVSEVIYRRCWEDVTFRAENGIGEFYRLLGQLSQFPLGLQLEKACHDMATTQRNYIVHSFRVQTYLFRMAVIQSEDEEDNAMRYVLRGTLRSTLVAFGLFLNKHVDKIGMDTTRASLSRFVFRDESNVLGQWPAWNSGPTFSVPVDDITCPITLESVKDGVIASDGHLYEREAILKHMMESCTSPITRECLAPELVSWTHSVCH